MSPPRRGVTCHPWLSSWSSSYFNSHPHEGGDFFEGFRLEPNLISILTSAKGVTLPCPRLRLRWGYFNSHPREGGDGNTGKNFVEKTNFNSHPREGGDDRRGKPLKKENYFNSHPREGGDPALAPLGTCLW